MKQIGFVALLDGFTGLVRIPNLKMAYLSNRCHKTPELGSSRYKFGSQQWSSGLATAHNFSRDGSQT